jgi:hypothetical protein
MNKWSNILERAVRLARRFPLTAASMLLCTLGTVLTSAWMIEHAIAMRTRGVHFSEDSVLERLALPGAFAMLILAHMGFPRWLCYAAFPLAMGAFYLAIGLMLDFAVKIVWAAVRSGEAPPPSLNRSLPPGR